MRSDVSEADDQMDAGEHRLAVDYESTYDRVRRKWTEAVTGVMFAQDIPSSSSQGSSAMGQDLADR